MVNKKGIYTLSNCLLPSCFTAECCKFKSTIDPSHTVEQKIYDVCKGNIKYGKYSINKPWNPIIICRCN